ELGGGVFEREAMLVQLRRQPLERHGLLAGVNRELSGATGGPPIGTPGALNRVEEKDQADTSASDADTWEGYSSASSAPPTPAIVATVSPSSRRMMITPWVCLPATRMFSIGVRITWPPSEMTISCSPSGLTTTRIPTNGPVRSVMAMVKTPWPPRECAGYSASGVSLP